MARLLLIVSRTEPALYTCLKHVFDSGTADVILDRRVGDRRQHDITEDLKTFDCALVRP